MPFITIVCGILLTLVGLVGYVVGIADGRASYTALIPAAFGVLFFILGAISRSNENLRKHLMHAAAVVALIGFLASAGRLVSKLSSLTLGAAVISQLAMALICLILLIFAIRSFAAARRLRGQSD